MEIFKQIAEGVALSCEILTVAAVALGAAQTIARAALKTSRLAQPEFKKELWIGFAGWLVLALEFALAADIAHTAIAPTWNDIGQLAAIATIRTVLNLFLERDLEKFVRPTSARADG